MDMETRVFVKTFGSKLPFMMDLTNVSKTGFQNGYWKHDAQDSF